MTNQSVTIPHPSGRVNLPDTTAHMLTRTISVPQPQPQFSQVNTFVLNGPAKLVAITGQLAIHVDDATKPPPPDFEDQVRMVCIKCRFDGQGSD